MNNVKEHKKIGKWLKTQRKLAGISQSQLADQVRCDKSFVGRYESGRRLDIVQFTKIALALNAKPCEALASCIEGWEKD